MNKIKWKYILSESGKVIAMILAQIFFMIPFVVVYEATENITSNFFISISIAIVSTIGLIFCMFFAIVVILGPFFEIYDKVKK